MNGAASLRVNNVGSMVMEAIGADPVRNELPLWQRHQLSLEIVPEAVDGASPAPGAKRHLEREQLAGRGAGSGSAGSA
jgi:hypothetical protein